MPQSNGDAPAQRLGDLLQEARTATRTRAELEAELRSLGEPALAAMLDAVRTRRFLANGQRVPLRPEEERLLTAALARLPRSSVRAAVEKLLAEGLLADDPGGRAALARVVGALGGAEELALLGRLCLPGEDPPSREDRAVFRRSLDEILARDPAHLSGVAPAFRSVAEALVAPLVEGVAGCASKAALECCVELLGARPAADSLLLLHIGRLGEELHGPFPSNVSGPVRRYLGSSELELALLAVNTLGSLGDREAVPSLMQLFESPEPAVAKRSLAILQELSGETIGLTPSRWTAWYAAEEAWWQQEAPLVFNDLQADPEAAAEALITLTRHRLYRHEIAQEVARVLSREEPELVHLATSTLGYLGSWTAVPALEACLEDPAAPVRLAAARSLRLITGRDPGALAGLGPAGR
jgi:hypothetical protein